MNQEPISIFLSCAAAFFLLRLWRKDYRKTVNGLSEAGMFPGASPTGRKPVLVAIGVSLLILIIETTGEYALGVSEEQTDISWLYLPGMIAAGFIEEILFRGFFVIDKKGRMAFLAGVVGFSALFTLAHFQYWIKWKGFEGGWPEIRLNPQSAWTLLILFTNSIWFYAVRFFKLNSRRSLIPCFAAHISSNIGVFAIKLIQGHVTAWY